MTFIPTQKSFFQATATVAFLAFAFFFSTEIQAQDIRLTPRNGNALYIGVENPVQVTVPGIPSENIYVASDGIEIDKLENGLFNIRVSEPGKVTLTVHGEGFQYKNFEMEVKRLPDPMKKQADPIAALKMANGLLKKDGTMAAAEFRQAVGLGAYLPEVKGEAAVGIASYNMVYVPKVGDPIEVNIQGSDFNDLAKGLVAKANAGDKFYFEKVMGSVVGEQAPRAINSLVFKIK